MCYIQTMTTVCSVKNIWIPISISQNCQEANTTKLSLNSTLNIGNHISLYGKKLRIMVLKIAIWVIPP